MATVITLHIGLPKSGTTFLQTRMWANRPRLRQQGMLYPGRSRMDHFHGTKIARGLAGDDSSSAGAWSRVLGPLRDWGGTGLVSHEFFCIADAVQARRVVAALPADDVRVVITARDYVRQFPAVWQEALKMGTAQGFGEYIERQLGPAPSTGPWGWASQDLPAIVERWSEAVGHDRLAVITVPPSGTSPDLLWRRWCTAVGIDDTGFDFDLARANQSLGAAQAAVLTQVVPHVQGPLLQGPERHRWLRHYLGHQVLLDQGGAPISLSGPHRAQLTTRAQDAVRRLQQLELTVHGDLQDLVPVSDPGHGVSPDDVPLSEQLAVAGIAMEHMVRDVRRLSEERDQLRRRAATRRATTLTSRLRRLPATALGTRLRRAARRRGGSA